MTVKTIQSVGKLSINASNCFNKIHIPNKQGELFDQIFFLNKNLEDEMLFTFIYLRW